MRGVLLATSAVTELPVRTRRKWEGHRAMVEQGASSLQRGARKLLLRKPGEILVMSEMEHLPSKDFVCQLAEAHTVQNANDLYHKGRQEMGRQPYTRGRMSHLEDMDERGARHMESW